MSAKIYEMITIMNPNLATEIVEQRISQWQGIITGMGGQITKISRWGKRNLAYDVAKFRQGIFVLMHVQGEPKVKDEIERQFKITDDVIKFQTVRLDESQLSIAQSIAEKIETSTTAFTDADRHFDDGESDQAPRRKPTREGDGDDFQEEDDFEDGRDDASNRDD